MQKINFQNLPSTTTPINATNLNAIQSNIEDVFNGTVPATALQISNSAANQKSTLICKRTDLGNQIEFGIGAGGTNRGIFDEALQKWLFHTDGTDVYVDGKKVSDYMYDSGWQNITPTTGTWSYCQIRRIGKVVHFRAYASSLGVPSGAFITIPAGYRPSQNENAYGENGWVSAPTIARWWFNTDGSVGIDWSLSLVNGTNITENTWKRVFHTWFID